MCTLILHYVYLQSDFANNEKFITLHIAKSDGQRIYFPGTYHKVWEALCTAILWVLIVTVDLMILRDCILAPG